MDSSGIWAFYYIQGEDGEDRSHPNAFKIPANADVTLADVLRHFPLKDPAQFHFRFRINVASKTGGGNTFFWLDITNPSQKIPLVNGRVICKLLRLARLAKVGLIFKRKPVLKWSNDAKPRNSLSSTDAQGSTKTSVQPLSRQQSGGEAPFHRSSSSPAFEKDRPAKYSDGNGNSSKTSSGNSSRTNSGSQAKVEQTAPAESFEDFLSGGGQPSSSQSAQKPPVNLMNDSGWNDAPTTSQKPKSDFLSSMDPLAQVNNASSNRPAASSAPTEQPKFDDDNGQTVGPVTMAEMKKYAASTSDGSNVYNPKFVDKSTKSDHVRRAMEERERQVQMDVEKAREDLRQREETARNMNVMKENAALVLGPKLKAWAEDNGRTKNIRTLLSTMHQVMWEGSKWTEVNMGKLLQPADVKKNYRKAMIVVHPDKSGGRNAEQLLIAERIFAAVNTAWDEFIKTNPC
uniref:DIX domain-containing protein n=1 Tax=Globisporangium ultimum (strain ATCC 200006 / CBS 805.95 / DAOM BR144) TaxID=431595 RepID=K3X1V6_GLOUD